MALFLGLTMLPFAIVAPLIGPFLDRFSHGRRWAIGATMAIRAFLCWVLADAVAGAARWRCSRRRSACWSRPRRTASPGPPRSPGCCRRGLTLVKANSRISLAGVVGAAVSAPLAVAGVARSAPQWSLRYAFLVFAGATILAILLPAAGRRPAGEEPVRPGADGAAAVPRCRPTVVFALRCNAGLRMLSRLPDDVHGLPAARSTRSPAGRTGRRCCSALVIGAAGLGNTIGIGLGSVLRRIKPAVTVVVALLADAAVARGRRGLLRAAHRDAPRPDRRASPRRWASSRSTR